MVYIDTFHNMLKEMVRRAYAPFIEIVKHNKFSTENEVENRKQHTFTNKQWHDHIELSKQSNQKVLEQLKIQQHPLNELRFQPIDADFLTHCERATVEDWEVINTIISDMALESSFPRSKYGKAIRSLKLFNPTHSQIFHITCSYCKTSWSHHYIGKSNPNIQDKTCSQCGISGKGFNNAKALSITEAKQSEMRNSLLFELGTLKSSKKLASMQPTDLDYEVTFYEKFTSHIENLPNHILIVINNLKTFYEKDKKDKYPFSEFPLSYKSSHYSEYLKELEHYGILLIEDIPNDYLTAEAFVSDCSFLYKLVDGCGGCSLNAISSAWPDNFIGKPLAPSSAPSLPSSIDIKTQRFFRLNPYFMKANFQLAKSEIANSYITSERDLIISQEKPSIKIKRIYVITTSENSKGFLDFLERVHIDFPLNKVFLKNNTSNENGIYLALKELAIPIFGKHDLIVFVRGGGDLTHHTFNAFNSTQATFTVRKLKSLGATIITGIAHSTDRVLIDNEADYPESTPTRAAERVTWLLNSKTRG